MHNIDSYELIDVNELQHLQEEFCRVTGVCACCMDSRGQRVTEMSGTGQQLERAAACEKSGRFQEVLERVAEDSLEEQAVEETEQEGEYVAAVAVRLEGEAVLYWLLIFDRTDAEDASLYFFNVLDLLRSTSAALIKNKLFSFSAEAQSRRSRFVQEEQESTRQTVEAVQKLLQLLDSEERFEKLMDRWVSIMGQYLGVDTAVIFRLYPEQSTMDVVCQWLAEGQLSYFDKTSRQKLYPWCLTEKQLVYSADTSVGEYWDEIRQIGLKAMMFLPFSDGNGKLRMAVSLNHREKHYVFSTAEIKFASDAVRVLQSILVRKIQKEALENSRQMTGTLLNSVSCGVYVKDRETKEVLFVNRKLQNTFAGELRDDSFERLLQDGIERGRESGCYEINHVQRERWYDLSIKTIFWGDGRDADMYSLYDITDKKLYQRKIEQQAYTDFLTGLYNRMCCERDLARQIDEAKKTDTEGAILYLDLDDFKHINDGLGHQYGDVLLKAISGSIQRIRGIENTCYRMGGDEFVIVIPPDRYAELDRIVEDIRAIFEKPWFLKDADYYCTMSMGIVEFPEQGDSVTDLVKKADVAMYEAKRDGKNRIARYSAEISSASGRRLDMEKSMRDATVGGYDEFEVYYQPIVDVQGGGKCAGAEALIRWNNAKLGFIPPAEFIPLAEYLGLINPIGNYVLMEACKVCKQWNDNGYPDYKVNVNLSVVQLLQPDIVEIVEKAVEETGIQPRNLTLEVTESLAINDMGRMQGILGRIKALGVKIALDDFGTGYSSLNHIREIPFDVIKVDQSFVKTLAKDAYSQSFVKMVAELAQTLGANICVEGIETEAQYTIVKDMKVKYIQGFYFDCPMCRSAFEKKYCP